MVNKKKRYVATLSNEFEAAQVYDKVAIQFHGGRVSGSSDRLGQHQIQLQ
jgi:hypothetical protein